MFDWLVGVVAPHSCIGCGKEGSLLCAWCLPDAVSVVPERCYRCHAHSQDSSVCRTCRRQTPLTYVWIRGDYTSTAKALIYRLKFGRTRAAAQVVTTLVDEAVPALSPNVIVTYVPTATHRLRQRGYDHAQLIARDFARHRGLACKQLLIRHGQARQVGSDRTRRHQQAAYNYRPLPRADIQGQTILLIDDIITTGATIESAARVLKQAGAKEVYAAIFAQKQ